MDKQAVFFGIVTSVGNMLYQRHQFKSLPCWSSLPGHPVFNYTALPCWPSTMALQLYYSPLCWPSLPSRPACPKDLVLTTRLQQLHQWTLNPALNYNPALCGKGFTSRKHLKRNMQIFQIPVLFLGKGVISWNHKKSHMKSHSGDKTYLYALSD